MYYVWIFFFGGVILGAAITIFIMNIKVDGDLLLNSASEEIQKMRDRIKELEQRCE